MHVNSKYQYCLYYTNLDAIQDSVLKDAQNLHIDAQQQQQQQHHGVVTAVNSFKFYPPLMGYFSPTGTSSEETGVR